MNASEQPQTGTVDWEDFGKYRSRILHTEAVAKNVHSYVLETPEGFTFTPGQAIELSIDERKWREEKRPFTITSLPSNPRLELVVKSYPVASNPNHDGMTEHLGSDIKVFSNDNDSNHRSIIGYRTGTGEACSGRWQSLGAGRPQRRQAEATGS